MPSLRLMLMCAGTFLATSSAFGQSLRPAIPGPDRINPNGSYASREIRFAEATEPRPQGPGVGYGVTYFGWPLVPYYGGSASGPGLSGLGPLALVSNYPGAGYGFTAPSREAAIRAEIAENDRLAREELARSRLRRATVMVELPASAEVWLNDRRQKGSASEWMLTSALLPPDSQATFTIRAQWTDGGTRYEWERVVTAAAGDKSRIVVARGTPVKK